MFGCFAPSITAYAVGDSWTSAKSYTYFENHFEDINTRLNGVIINQSRLLESFEDYLQEYRDNYNIPSGTSTQTWIGDNISGSYQNGSSGVADLSFSQTFRQAMRDWCDTYLEANTGFKYVYSFGSADMISRFDTQTQYHAFLNVLQQNEGKFIFGFASQNGYFCVLDDCLLVSQSYDSTHNVYKVKPYVNWSLTNSYTLYQWNSQAGEYQVTQNYTDNGSPSMAMSYSTPFYYGASYCINTNRTQFIMYNSVDSMRNGSEGIQDYYTVQDSYNSIIDGSYNTTTNNISNTLNDSDVNNYINNYYVENGSYPTPNQINVYITNNIDNGSGGSGGSGDNGSGDNDGPNWDFGFLGTIGEFLAELISGLGEIVGGILSAITSIVSSLREGIPNTIGLFLEWFFPFLPNEIVALIELSILCAVVLGVVRLIRGH